MIYELFLDRLAVTGFALLLVLAALFDARELRIPNRVCLGIVALFPLHAAVASPPLDWVVAVALAAAVFAVGAGLYASARLGGGDVKLLAAASLWAGWEHLPALLVVTALSGGVLALAVVTPARFALALALERAGSARVRDAVLSGVLPYGVAIAAGGLAVAWALLSATVR